MSRLRLKTKQGQKKPCACHQTSWISVSSIIYISLRLLAADAFQSMRPLPGNLFLRKTISIIWRKPQRTSLFVCGEGNFQMQLLHIYRKHDGNLTRNIGKRTVFSRISSIYTGFSVPRFVFPESILVLLHLDGPAGHIVRPEVAHDPVRETDDDFVVNGQIDDDAFPKVPAQNCDPPFKAHGLSLRCLSVSSVPDRIRSRKSAQTNKAFCKCLCWTLYIVLRRLLFYHMFFFLSIFCNNFGMSFPCTQLLIFYWKPLDFSV